ncbi:hypothetical protein DYB30_000758 [Aphanomyces astaci]|uniref:Anthranilate synthase n=1 Tax=Aphanomyces astaci TaxID=112090 RepID=A0A397D922_APHAT|nr:hypothetical protein DYB36_012018 [Aphanomyces astaci]RHY61027.1 hypothetical protein DYB30_000758 [Aphanomyces astaci]RHY62091.1 hypothetical protein DYB34_007313 [Aphanomyces astaci]RHZ07370.1 hypothetical protein DYB31_000366 [Aphanomyces astaci]
MPSIHPTFADAKKLHALHATDKDLLPIYLDLTADLDTPVSVYLKLRQQQTGDVKQSFLLESIFPGENIARYSLIGTDPLKTLLSGPNCAYKGDPLVQLEQEMKTFRVVHLPELDVPMTGGAVGYCSFDAVRHFEPTVGPFVDKQTDIFGIPESMYMLFNTIVVFDHVFHSLKVVTHVNIHGDFDAEYQAASDRILAIQGFLDAPLARSSSSAHVNDKTALTEVDYEAISNVGRDKYMNFVTTLKTHIVDGDIFQAVPSHRLNIPLPATVTSFDLYRQMRVINPSPYMFYLDFADGLEVRCLLLERAEHIMLVDLGRNDVGRVAVPGSVKVEALMKIEKYSHVMHIVSVVKGELRQDKSIYDAYRALFPAGTLTGAPKVKAMQLICGLEQERRGIYGGSVGYIGFNGVLDTAIAIRTIVVHNRRVYCQAGAGIVYDSDPAAEYHETIIKLGSAVRTVEKCVHHKESNA